MTIEGALTDREVMTALGWEDFLDGEWTHSIPTRAGTYPIADSIGNPNGNLLVTQHMLQDGNWDWNNFCAWYWSVPYPSMPPAPMVPFEEDETR